MEYSAVEIAVVQQAASEVTSSVIELDLLQLALVGGGIGDPIAA